MKRRVSLPVSPMAGSLSVDKSSVEYQGLGSRNITKTLDFPDLSHTGSTGLGTIGSPTSLRVSQ